MFGEDVAEKLRKMEEKLETQRRKVVEAEDKLRRTSLDWDHGQREAERFQYRADLSNEALRKMEQDDLDGSHFGRFEDRHSAWNDVIKDKAQGKEVTSVGLRPGNSAGLQSEQSRQAMMDV